MRFNTMFHSLFGVQGIRGGRRRQRIVPAVLLCLVVTACQRVEPIGLLGQGAGFRGMVAADEPRAVEIGRDILAAGGSPADAAVAMAFVLSVTLPSEAGLGGGGACLVYDHGQAKTEAIDFAAPVPAMARGMFALHAKYGRLHWENMLAPAEALARTGTGVSRAFARRLAQAPARLLEDRETRRIYARPDGHLLSEGDLLVQSDLGAVLSRLRTRGIGELYGAAAARDLAAAAGRAGGAFTAEQIQNFLPRWQEPLKASQGNDVVFFMPPPSAAGPIEAAAWGGGDAAGRGKRLTEFYAASPAGERPAGTGLVVMDGLGSAVACSLGLNASFGTGRIIPDTGILLAAGGGRQHGPILSVNPNSNEFRFAVAGGGAAAVLQVALSRGVDGTPIDVAVAASRPVEGGLVNALACASGDPTEDRCVAANDPRGAGLSALVAAR